MRTAGTTKTLGAFTLQNRGRDVLFECASLLLW
jgi:hypothetical protein